MKEVITLLTNVTNFVQFFKKCLNIQLKLNFYIECLKENIPEWNEDD